MDEIRPPKPQVSFDDFARLDLRIARVLECREHPNADRLLILNVDLGNETRQICAGLKNHYKPEELIGRLIVVLANLEPRHMRGEASQGMLLVASEGPMKEHVIVLSPSADVKPGSVVS